MNYEEDIAKVGRWTGRRERKSVDGRWIMKMIYFPFVFFILKVFLKIFYFLN
jgi:hypothetical protein